MNSRVAKGFVLFVLASILAMVVWVVYHELIGVRSSGPRRTKEQVERVNPPVLAEGDRKLLSEKPEPQIIATTGSNAKTNSQHRMSLAEREELLHALKKQLGDGGQNKNIIRPRSSEQSSSTSQQPNSDDMGSLDKETIRNAVRELVPLIQECYEMALDENVNVQGKFKVSFTIIGDESLGGLVEQSEIVKEQGQETSPTLEECIRETMYGLKIENPKGGGRVKVTYPFIFKNKT